jgi:tetratricopeptide (TPR) repeat protein
MANLTLMLNRAVSAYNTGKLFDAEQICEQIVTKKRNFFEALYLLATIQSRLNKKDAALENYDRALALRPNVADALNNRGVILHALKRFEAAVASYDRALAVKADYAEAFYNRGVTFQALDRLDESLASYDRAIAVQPNHAAALNNRGNVLKGLKRLDEALASYDRSLAVRPNDAGVYHSRGNILMELGRLDEALASYDRSVAIRPNHAETYYNRGVTLQKMKRLDEALTSYERALALRPDYAEAFCNRGVILHELNRFDEALASYDRALIACPDLAEALSNRGNTLQALKRFDEALAGYMRAIAVRPDFADAHWHEALLRLLTGDFDRGWRKYEWRWETERLRNTKRKFTQPLWIEQTEIAGKTILLHAEQGFGDAIQFCRYVPLVAARGARVILEVQRPLVELMGDLAGAAQVVSRGDSMPDFDFHCPLLSLPLAFTTRLETIPSSTPYLRARSQALKKWGELLGPRGRPRIGLAWSGSPTHTNDRNRSISLSSLISLLDVDASFVSLQKDIRSDDAAVLKARSDLPHFGDALNDFSDTAALVSHLDLVIAVDTSVAHLAGALAKPVWVMLPFVPDWRWLLDRNDSPWYPSARLFRQDATRMWDGVIARVHAALHDFVQSRS